jgi:hypothetical protein
MSYTNPFPNVPSASKLHRVMNCQASHKAELAAGDVPEDLTDANEGQDVHAVLSDDLSADDVSASAAQTAEMCEEQTQRLLTEWQEPGEVPLKFMEVRYAFLRARDRYYVAAAHPDILGEVVFTGQFDRLYTQERKCKDCEGTGWMKQDGTARQCPECKGVGKLNHGLLIDFKALHGKHAGALENLQLMGLSALVTKRHKLTSLRVALVQPWKGKPTIADYGKHGLALAESMLLQILEDERKASPEDRHAGDHCTYCKARFTCSTFQSANIEALDIIEPATIAGDSKHQSAVIFARMAELSIPQLVHIQKNVRQMMGVFLASHAAVFKQRVEAGEVPGFALKEKSGRRKINDVGMAFLRAEQHGVTPEAFAAKCSLSLKGLNEALKDATNKKGKALELIADEILHGICDTGKPTFEVVETSAIE